MDTSSNGVKDVESRSKSIHSDENMESDINRKERHSVSYHPSNSPRLMNSSVCSSTVSTSSAMLYVATPPQLHSGLSSSSHSPSCQMKPVSSTPLHENLVLDFNEGTNELGDKQNVSPDRFENMSRLIANSGIPKPKLSLQHASESSSDEKDKGRRKAASSHHSPMPKSSKYKRPLGVSDESSRETSFDRSVSFQEGLLRENELKENSMISELNRSLDQMPPASPASITSQTPSSGKEKDRKDSREGKNYDKKSRTKPWYNVLNPTYKSRSQDLKRLFKDLPSDERLIVDYSCALQRDILVHGRLYGTQNYFCFYSKIFGWETFVCIRCKEIRSMTKEKTALVIPNALQICTDTEKYFLTTFAARDKAYLTLFRIWQNALLDQQMSPTELWQRVHSSYGEELGWTSGDDDFVAPSTEDDMRASTADENVKKYTEVSTEDASQNEVERRSDRKSPHGGVSNSDLEPERKSSTKSSPRKSPPKTSPHHPPYLSSSTYSDGMNMNSSNKEEADIPTDQSDAVDSDVERMRVAGNSSESVVCPDVSSHHMGREAVNSVYQMPIDTLFTLLFTNSKFMLDLQISRKTYDVISSPWQSNPETNQKIRQVTYTMTLPTNSFGPKVSHVTETQVLSAFSVPGRIYTVDSEACNAGIPYADAFYISNHWCLTSESPNETRLCVWAQVKYKKNMWGFMKNVIDKNVFTGIESHMNELEASLHLEVETTQKRTKRRRRRAGSKSEGPELFSHIAADSTKGSVFETHKSTAQIPTRKMTLTPASVNEIESPFRWRKLSYLLIPVLILLSLNGFLYYRLTDLDERVFKRQDFSRAYSFHNLGANVASDTGDTSLETWIHILQEQEALHLEEVQRWKSAVVEAADYLRKAEESLRSLQASIPQQQASKIQSLLQHLHRLQAVKDAEVRDGLSISNTGKANSGEELHGDSAFIGKAYGEKEKC